VTHGWGGAVTRTQRPCWQLLSAGAWRGRCKGFAFAPTLWDRDHKHLTPACDRIVVRPCSAGSVGEGEYARKVISGSSLFGPALAHYVWCTPVLSPVPGCEGNHKLPPGTCRIVDGAFPLSPTSQLASGTLIYWDLAEAAQEGAIHPFADEVEAVMPCMT